MKNLFKEYDLEITEIQAEKFGIYYGLLKEYNEKFNLTSITEEREVYVKHFIDSVKGYKMLRSGKLIDVGSGGGFPALPLKIIDENIELTMLEATGKKCKFLETVVKELDLKNVEVIEGRAEELSFNDKYRESFDNCTARAVARLNILSEYCLPFVKKGGIFVAYKGNAEEEIKEAEKAVKILGGRIGKIEKFTLEGAERTLISIEKTDNTDRKYPRTNAKIRKNPL